MECRLGAIIFLNGSGQVWTCCTRQYVGAVEKAGIGGVLTVKKTFCKYLLLNVTGVDFRKKYKGSVLLVGESLLYIGHCVHGLFLKARFEKPCTE